ncbi:phosphotransferase [Streptomyces sp. NPDC007851]|uniref:phosphotransferase n=1 Tax=Streptomyces sp. NPDC007851 TaxID=3155008 RepID=UPI0033FB6257
MPDPLGPSDVPTAPRDITPEFLTRALRRGGREATGRIAAVTVAGGRHAGMFGSVRRLRVRYTDPQAHGPRSVMLKLPSREFAESRAFGALEARLYLQRARLLPDARTAEVYYCAEGGNGSVCLLLEDLGDAGFVRQYDGCTPDQASRALRAVAPVHARWWGRQLPGSAAWVRPPGQSLVGEFCRGWIHGYDGDWPDLLEPVMPRLAARYERVAGVLAAGPVTLVHGDFHSQNVSFAGEAADGPARLVDFQFVQRATGLQDVARFLATSLTTEVRRAAERDLLTEYLACLAAHGVTGYGFDACVADLRAALLWNLTTPVALHIRGITTEGRPWPTSMPILERCLTAVDDWDATRLL